MGLRMDFQPKALVVAVMLVGAVVWVAAEVAQELPPPPGAGSAPAAPSATHKVVDIEESLLANERVVASNEATAPPSSPAPSAPLAQPSGSSTPAREAKRATAAPRLASARPTPKARPVRQAAALPSQRRGPADERLRVQVVDALGRSPGISGVIAVESHESVVRLSGYTLTAGQAHRAGRAAASVPGVRRVQNDLRPRIGA